MRAIYEPHCSGGKKHGRVQRRRQYDFRKVLRGGEVLQPLCRFMPRRSEQSQRRKAQPRARDQPRVGQGKRGYEVPSSRPNRTEFQNFHSAFDLEKRIFDYCSLF